VDIGAGCQIDEHVIIKPFTKIGKNVIIRSNSDIGSDGFEVAKVNGQKKIVKHGGMVIIGDDVEIQSLNTISRGLFPSRNTIIDSGVKTADLVHIAHGVQVGAGTMITAGVTISGNTTIGKNVVIGPGAAISNRILIGDDAEITIGSVVVRNVQNGEKVTGNFAIEHQNFIKSLIKSGNI